MKVLLCCILKMENKYLEEWVNHYKKLGIDKIVIYDNNDVDGKYEEHIEDILSIKEHINNNYIDVYKIPNETCVQLKYYNECYKKYSDYDWLIFLDIDEFLILEKFTNIKDFLKQDKFKNFDIIHLNWKTFTDNNLIHVENNNYSLVNRFTTPCKDIKSLNKNVDKEIKSIVRGNIKNLFFSKNPHTLDSIQVPCCDALGKITSNKDQKNNNIIHTEAWINHYICKTVEEYCNNKLVRLGGHTSHKNNMRYTRSFFFRYNEFSIEKLRILNKICNNTRVLNRYILSSSYSPRTRVAVASPVNLSVYSKKPTPTETGNIKKVRKLKILPTNLVN